jgi:hypothetical protein
MLQLTHAVKTLHRRNDDYEDVFTSASLRPYVHPLGVGNHASISPPRIIDAVCKTNMRCFYQGNSQGISNFKDKELILCCAR